MSLDRSVGGRTFGALIFVGTVVTGASLGEQLQLRADRAALYGSAIQCLPADPRKALASVS